jgi:hypothetical protein
LFWDTQTSAFHPTLLFTKYISPKINLAQMFVQNKEFLTQIKFGPFFSLPVLAQNAIGQKNPKNCVPKIIDRQ